MTEIRHSWGTTFFCDDIRMEAGNKVTFVGTYPDEIVVHGPFPFVLPKFGMWISYFEIPDTEQEDGKLAVWFPGDTAPAIEAEIPLSQLRKQAAAHPNRGDPTLDRWIHVQTPILLAPVVLKEAGFIKVRMLFGDREVRLGAISVRSQAPNVSPSEMPPPS